MNVITEQISNELTIILSDNSSVSMFLHGEEHLTDTLSILSESKTELIKLKGYRFQYGEPSADYYLYRSKIQYYRVQERKHGDRF